MKHLIKHGLTVLLLILLMASGRPHRLQRFQYITLDYLDTMVHVIGYANSEFQFNSQLSQVTDELERLHHLFTTFYEVPGVNNLWYVNQQAGLAPVEVDPAIISLLQAGIEAYHQTNGMLNIALGSVLDIWHRERSSPHPTVPTLEELQAAKVHVDINDIILDPVAGTVFIRNPNMSIEVGSIAKGYIIERAIHIAEQVGMSSILISAGGDIRMLAAPPGRGRSWGTAIQNPWNPYDAQSRVDSIRGEHMAVFTSGTYQRFFEIDGIRYHHIINPTTLFPANLYQSITIIHDNSMMAEILTTALYMLSIEEGQELLNKLGGYALWLTYDGYIFVSDGYSQFSDNF